MLANKISDKRKVEREVFSVSLAFLDIPPTSTPEGIRLYRINQRKIEKIVQNQQFVKEFTNQYNGFADFLQKYDLNTRDLQKFLGTDMRLLVKRIEAKK
jgi:hypothetical protein